MQRENLGEEGSGVGEHRRAGRDITGPGSAGGQWWYQYTRSYEPWASPAEDRSGGQQGRHTYDLARTIVVLPGNTCLSQGVSRAKTRAQQRSPSQVQAFFKAQRLEESDEQGVWERRDPFAGTRQAGNIERVLPSSADYGGKRDGQAERGPPTAVLQTCGGLFRLARGRKHCVCRKKTQRLVHLRWGWWSRSLSDPPDGT